jgi:hypothetical protein
MSVGYNSAPRQPASRTPRKHSGLKDPSPVSAPKPSADPTGTLLDSWKAIATYVKRDVSTAQRWEKCEGMPIHRHVHDKGSSVYAFSSELDGWLQSRGLRLDEQENWVEASEGKKDDRGPADSQRARNWLVLGGALALTVLAVTFVMARTRAGDATQTRIKSLAVQPLKNLPGSLAKNPNCVVGTPNAAEAVMLEGVAELTTDPAIAKKLEPTSLSKYGMSGGDGSEPLYRVRPTRVFGLREKSFQETVTRGTSYVK